ncbi:MAG: hypothetical protein HY903_00165 [Deltaproteobacteria bacterium]|nr:hypothetical protein [Deltaproteobacteria bacterium]
MLEQAHLSRFTLERLVAGELEPQTNTHVFSHLETCAECRAARDALVQDVLAFKAEVPYAAFRIEHERRDAARARRPWTWQLAASLATGAAAALVLVAVVTLPEAPVADGIRSKGDGVALTFSVVAPDGVRPGTNGEVLDAGATLQLSYDAGDFTHMAVFGVDAAKTVSVYFPEGEENLAPPPAGPEGALPFSLTLDRTVGPERFVAVFSKSALPLSGLLERLRQAGTGAALVLPEGVAGSTIGIEKR